MSLNHALLNSRRTQLLVPKWSSLQLVLRVVIFIFFQCCYTVGSIGKLPQLPHYKRQGEPGAVYIICGVSYGSWEQPSYYSFTSWFSFLLPVWECSHSHSSSPMHMEKIIMEASYVEFIRAGGIYHITISILKVTTPWHHTLTVGQQTCLMKLWEDDSSREDSDDRCYLSN